MFRLYVRHFFPSLAGRGWDESKKSMHPHTLSPCDVGYQHRCALGERDAEEHVGDPARDGVDGAGGGREAAQRAERHVRKSSHPTQQQRESEN